jgi:trigger factor
MKTEFTDVSETHKTLAIEIPSEVVDAEIARVARDYAKQAKIPGFRPGKVPAGVIKQRFKDQILHDVMHGLIPRAVEDALQERGIEPIDTPDIKDVSLTEGRPLTFTAAIQTLPPFDPGDLSTISVHAHPVTITEDAVDQTLQQLRERGAKYEPVEGRPVAEGDSLVVDLTRTDAAGQAETHDGVTIELGSPANPPGFDAQLTGMNTGDVRTFPIQFPKDYPVEELANAEITYQVTLKEIRHKVLPDLDDEFAKDVGDFDSLATLRTRVHEQMKAEGEAHARQHTRGDLLKKLAARVTFDLPASLVEREMDRRLEEFVRQLMAQNIDPREAGIDWAQFREAQREAARDSVASALMLDEIARREQITVGAEDVDKEIEQFALRAGRTPAALRAQLEKEGGISRLYAGLRREKAVDFALARVTLTDEAHHETPAAEEDAATDKRSQIVLTDK